MKKIISLIAFLQVSVICLAQNANTKMDVCPLLAQYQGEWKYTDGIITIRIFLRAHQDYSIAANRITDRLYGWLEYKNGSIVIESNLQHKDMILPYLNDSSDSLNVSQYSATLSLKECTNSFPELHGTIIDHLQLNEIHMVKTILSANQTMMLWKQTRREGYGTGTGANGMTLPAEFLLIKQ
jgi:hypothetical protein